MGRLLLRGGGEYMSASVAVAIGLVICTGTAGVILVRTW
jgi:hypothetical protein